MNLLFGVSFASRHLLIIAILAGSATLQSQAPSPAPASNQDAEIIKRFDDRVKEYIKLHNQAEGMLPQLKKTPSAAKIVSHQQKLAHGIEVARHGAKQGDVFTPEVTPVFVRLVRNEFKGPRASSVRASIRRGEPVKLRLRVNQTYPEGFPLTTVPPTLLLNLPKLPKELEYRIVGHALVLHDIKANVIVDFIPDAVP